ncbi:MAG: hypothetical protein E7084_01125 [Bacteroidales bacterium]|nr:hypothetical protein [Bacteroidales bacterium]
MCQSLGFGEDRARIPPLTRERNLMNSINTVTLLAYNDLEYADIHNHDGRVHVTEYMQRLVILFEECR